jgi:hypothetical protein
MKPQYLTVAGTPVAVPLDNNVVEFDVTIRCAAGQTVDATLDDPKDPIFAPGAPAAQVWFPLTASPLGATIFTLTNPVRQVRITGAGQTTILQQGGI